MGRRVLPDRQGAAGPARRRRPRDRPLRGARHLSGPALRGLRALALLVSGGLVGAAAVVTHDRTTGLALGLLASTAATWALPGGWTWRFAFTAGWALLLAYVLLPRAGGGYLVQADLTGYLLLGYGLAQLVLGIVTVRPLRPPASGPADPT